MSYIRKETIQNWELRASTPKRTDNGCCERINAQIHERDHYNLTAILTHFVHCPGHIWSARRAEVRLLLFSALEEVFLEGQSFFSASFSPSGLHSYSDFRMVGDEVALTTANPKPCMKVALHTAFQCMVMGD